MPKHQADLLMSVYLPATPQGYIQRLQVCLSMVDSEEVPDKTAVLTQLAQLTDEVVRDACLTADPPDTCTHHNVYQSLQIDTNASVTVKAPPIRIPIVLSGLTCASSRASLSLQ